MFMYKSVIYENEYKVKAKPVISLPENVLDEVLPANMGDRSGQQSGSGGRASKLYPSLSFLEISVYTATWICGVMFALYSLYRASMEQVRSI